MLHLWPNIHYGSKARVCVAWLGDFLTNNIDESQFPDLVPVKVCVRLGRIKCLLLWDACAVKSSNDRGHIVVFHMKVKHLIQMTLLAPSGSRHCQIWQQLPDSQGPKSLIELGCWNKCSLKDRQQTWPLFEASRPSLLIVWAGLMKSIVCLELLYLHSQLISHTDLITNLVYHALHRSPWGPVPDC